MKIPPIDIYIRIVNEFYDKTSLRGINREIHEEYKEFIKIWMLQLPTSSLQEEIEWYTQNCTILGKALKKL